MIFEGSFNLKELEVLKYEFEVKDKKSIHIKLIEGQFKHFMVAIKDTSNNIRALLTYKTRLKEFCITEDFKTTSNYSKAGNIENGTWKLEIIKPSKILDGFKIEITFDEEASIIENHINVLEQDFDKEINSCASWYKGDLHAHSKFSDGRVSLEEIARKAEEKSFDYVSVTEHNTVTTKFPKCDQLIIPATEITLDDDGHYNAYGLKDFIDYGKFIENQVDKSTVIDNLFEDLNEKEVILSINHPYTIKKGVKHDFDISNLKVIEVINAPHLIDKEIDNDKAIKFFDYLWNNGHYLFGTGGSDSHKRNYFDEYPLGLPTTKIFCDTLSIRSILNGIKKGKMIIQNQGEFDIQCSKKGKTILPGERVSGEVEIFARSKKAVDWYLIKNGEIVKETFSKEYKATIDIKEDEFYRLEAREKNEIRLFMNPIHNMIKKPSEFRMQKLMNDFEK